VFVRVLNLTVGAGPFNFAVIVEIFILGPALGSLMLEDRLLSVTVLFRAVVVLIGYRMLLFYSVPCRPNWPANVRTLMADPAREPRAPPHPRHAVSRRGAAAVPDS
jgi:hypothetical protein